MLFSAVMVLGVATRTGATTRRWPRFAVAELHRTLSLFAIALLGLHVATAVLDPYVSISWIATLLPFTSHYETLAIGAGTLAVDLAGAVLITSLLRSRLGLRTWRAVHYLAYLAWPVAFVHAIRAASYDQHLWFVAARRVGLAGRRHDGGPGPADDPRQRPARRGRSRTPARGDGISSRPAGAELIDMTAIDTETNARRDIPMSWGATDGPWAEPWADAWAGPPVDRTRPARASGLPRQAATRITCPGCCPTASPLTRPAWPITWPGTARRPCPRAAPARGAHRRGRPRRAGRTRRRRLPHRAEAGRRGRAAARRGRRQRHGGRAGQRQGQGADGPVTAPRAGRRCRGR